MCSERWPLACVVCRQAWGAPFVCLAAGLGYPSAARALVPSGRLHCACLPHCRPSLPQWGCPLLRLLALPQFSLPLCCSQVHSPPNITNSALGLWLLVPPAGAALWRFVRAVAASMCGTFWPLAFWALPVFWPLAFLSCTVGRWPSLYRWPLAFLVPLAAGLLGPVPLCTAGRWPSAASDRWCFAHFGALPGS